MTIYLSLVVGSLAGAFMKRGLVRIVAPSVLTFEAIPSPFMLLAKTLITANSWNYKLKVAESQKVGIGTTHIVWDTAV
jgi:hypothetical protein